MAYVPHVWECGEIVTDGKMNNLEEGVQQALDCCGQGGGDCGFSCDNTYATIFDGSITSEENQYVQGHPIYDTIAGLDVSMFGDEIRVTYDGTVYNCPLNTSQGSWFYGATLNADFAQTDWSQYPFNIFIYLGNTIVSTQTEGNHTLKIEAVILSAVTTECFDTAVRQSSRYVVKIADFLNPSIDESYSEIMDAITSGKDVYAEVNYNNVTYICPVVYHTGGDIRFACNYISSQGGTHLEGITISVLYDDTVSGWTINLPE